MSLFQYTPATKSNSHRKNGMVMTSDVSRIAHGIKSTIEGTLPPHLFSIVVIEKTISAPTKQNPEATKIAQSLPDFSNPTDTDSMRVISLKSACYDVLSESGLIDLLPVEVFNSMVGRDYFKRSVCDRAIKAKS